jgi:hypothetical protein
MERKDAAFGEDDVGNRRRSTMLGPWTPSDPSGQVVVKPTFDLEKERE